MGGEGASSTSWRAALEKQVGVYVVICGWVDQ